MKQIEVTAPDVVIVGGGLGGVSAALSALRLGRCVVLVEALEWLGGQLTAQAVPPDEYPWVESVHASQSYTQLRHRIRDYYRRHLPLTSEARRSLCFNPGAGNVSTLCHEPWVAAKVIDELLAPWESGGQLQVMRSTRVIHASTSGDKVKAITVQHLQSGREQELSAPLFVDATETGTLLPLAGIEHVFGAESREQTGELHALQVADPWDQQAATWCFAMDCCPGEHHVIEKPPGYERFRTLRLPCWPNEQYSWTLSDFVTHQPRVRPLFAGPTDATGVYDLWHARRIAWRGHFEKGAYPSDITLANWPQMDYWEKPLIGVSEKSEEQALQEARNFSLGFLYWMQTEAPRHDGGTGYPELRLRGDVLGSSDGLAQQIYWREGRRILADFTVKEQHIGVAARADAHGAERFFDSVGIGAYRIDLHPSTTGRNTVDIDAYPFQIPLGALLPQRVSNLLPACKNIGTTRITNGAYREHATEWSIGEAVGSLAAFALSKDVPPRAVRDNSALLTEFQNLLAQQGVLLEWPSFGALTPLRRTGYQNAQA